MRLALVCVLSILAQVYALAAAQEQESKPNQRESPIMTKHVTYSEDFREGNVQGWESYPPFQDTGFDPYFHCEAAGGPTKSEYSLMLEYRPTFVTEHKMGFVRKLALVAGPTTKVSFFYKTNGYGDFKGMTMILYGSDGSKYSYCTSINDDRKWHKVNVSLDDFKAGSAAMKPGIGIGGFSITTDIPKTNPDVTYKLFLSDFRIAAREAVQFEIQKPVSYYLKNLGMIVTLHHYTAGEPLGLSAKLPRGVKLSKADVSLINPEDKPVMKDVPLVLNLSDNSWGKKDIYTFSDHDLPGQWAVKIDGENRKGEKIKTEFNVWLAKENLPHPRLFFRQKEIDNCKEKIGTEHWKAWWNSLVEEAAKSRETSTVGSIKFGSESSSLREVPPRELGLQSLSDVNFAVFDSVYLLPTLSHYFSIMESAGKILRENTLIYAVTGDKSAGDYAKDALIRIAKWKTWNHPWFAARHRETYYPMGELGVRAAFCYDIVYPLMTVKERDEVSEGLLKNCIIPAYDEYVLHDRTPSATTNWIGNTVGGGICCALAIYGDNPKLGDLEPYLSGLLRKFEMYFDNTLDTAGAWGEGISYQAFALSNDLPTISAIRHVLGPDLASEGLLNSYKYFLYNYSRPGILDNGDSHPELSTLSSFAWLSTHSKDPLFQWFYMKSPRNNILDFMFGSDSGAETPPNSLPESKEFPELGAVVFRSGWSSDDIVMNFRCGPWYNHEHYDQGSFQLNAFGESLIPEAGDVNYYADPWYQRYYIQPVGHNTLLVDHHAGSQESGDYLHFIKAANRMARITDFISTDDFSSVTGELADLYYGKLGEFQRNIVFLDRKCFVIYDKLKSSGMSHEYDLLFHFNNHKEVSLKPDNIFTFKTDRASLFARVIYPQNLEIKICGAPTRFGPPMREPGYVQVSNSRKSKDENFLTVLYPVKSTSELHELSGDIVKVEGKGCVGVNVRTGMGSDLLLFRTGSTRLEAGQVATDGRIAEVSIRDRKLSHFAASSCTYFRFKRNDLIKTEAPATFVGKIGDGNENWKIVTSDASRASIFSRSKPDEVKLNGKMLTSFAFDGHSINILLSKGANDLEIEF